MELPEEARLDILRVAEGLGPRQVSEGLRDLIAREKALFMSGGLDGDERAIVAHGLAVLTAAAAGYEQAASELDQRMAAVTVKV